MASAGVGFVTHGPAGAVGGWLAGGQIASVYKNAADNVMHLVDEAVRNPAAAAELRRFSATPNPQTLTPAVRQLLSQ